MSLCLLISICLFSADLPGFDGQTKSSADSKRRKLFLEMFARGYYAGRSGQIMLVPREGEVVTRPDPAYRFMHGSPWDYDTRIPLLFFGPRFIRPGKYTLPAGHQNIVPTLAQLIRLRLPPTVTAHPLTVAVNKVNATPRLIVLLVLDAMRADYFERYAAQLPTLLRLRQQSAWFSEARVNYLPTITPVGHATIGTGSDPRIHGIAGAVFFDYSRGERSDVYAEQSPQNLMVPTLTDLWGLRTRGEAIIFSQGGLFYAPVGLAGHGRCLLNGQADTLIAYDRMTGHWETNSKCYRIPAYLRDETPEPLWRSVAGRWLGHDISTPQAFSRAGLFSQYEGQTLLKVLENEPVGLDDITDLVLVNLKATDFVGHQYGPDSPELQETLRIMDQQLQRVFALLDHKVGPLQYVAVITADHGMPSEPEATGHQRHDPADVIALVHRRFDPEQGKLVRLYEASSGQLHLDLARLKELKLTLPQIADFLQSQPWVFATYTEDEVRSYAVPDSSDSAAHR